MRLLLLTLATLGFSAFPAFAGHNGKTHAPLQTITVKVDGMVCDFCARALEKVFYRRDGVEGVDVNLDTHAVTIEIVEGTQLSDEEITKLVNDSGYNVSEISR